MSAAWLYGEQADAVVAEVEAAMLAFNQAQLGPQAAQRYALARYAAQGDLLAGLVAWWPGVTGTACTSTSYGCVKRRVGAVWGGR